MCMLRNFSRIPKRPRNGCHCCYLPYIQQQLLLIGAQQETSDAGQLLRGALQGVVSSVTAAAAAAAAVAASLAFQVGLAMLMAMF